jgi:hypothetical protein
MVTVHRLPSMAAFPAALPSGQEESLNLVGGYLCDDVEVVADVWVLHLPPC